MPALPRNGRRAIPCAREPDYLHRPVSLETVRPGAACGTGSPEGAKVAAKAMRHCMRDGLPFVPHSPTALRSM